MNLQIIVDMIIQVTVMIVVQVTVMIAVQAMIVEVAALINLTKRNTNNNI